MLLGLVKDAFDKSDVRRNASSQGEEWNYSICDSRIEPGNLLLVGFNGGVDKSPMRPQKSEPTDYFLDVYRKRPKDLGNFIRVANYLIRSTSLSEQDRLTAGQINYCFFRSPQASEISDKDVLLCKPVFERLLEIAQPKRVLCFTERLKKVILREHPVTELTEQRIPYNILGTSRTFTACRGVLKTAAGPTPVCFLPHPNYPITGDARDEAWAFALID